MKATNKTILLTILMLIFITIISSDVKAQWKELSDDNPPARSGHTLVNIEGVVYVFGGRNAGAIFNDVWKWEEDKWTQVATTNSPSGRFEHTAHIVNGKMFVFFGKTIDGVHLSDIWEFDPAIKTWTELTTSGIPPSARSGHASVYDPNTNKAYLVGGTTENGGSSELFVYDFETNQWTEKADMVNFSVTNHGIGILDGYLIVFGGNSLFGQFSAYFFIYNLITDTWDSVMADGDDFIGRSDFSFTQLDQLIHVMGGYGEDGLFDDHMGIELSDDNNPFIIDMSASAPPIFADGFESGDATAWTDSNKRSANTPIQMLMFGGLSGTTYLDKTWYFTDCVTIEDSQDVTICEGESFGGHDQAGVYEDTYEAANGCDSVVTLNMSVLPAVNEMISMEICDGESYEDYSVSGVYEDTFTASNGCDSVRVLELTVAPSIEVTDTTIIADNGTGNGSITLLINSDNTGFSFEWNNGETTSTISNLEHGNYSVTVTDIFNCTEIFEFNVVLNTGIDDFVDDRIELFSNPVTDYITLQFSRKNKSREFEINLLNLDGKIIKNWNVLYVDSIIQLNVEDLNSGLYFLSIIDEYKMYSNKILITN